MQQAGWNTKLLAMLHHLTSPKSSTWRSKVVKYGQILSGSLCTPHRGMAACLPRRFFSVPVDLHEASKITHTPNSSRFCPSCPSSSESSVGTSRAGLVPRVPTQAAIVALMVEMMAFAVATCAGIVQLVTIMVVILTEVAAIMT
eukprot:g61491.t1